MTRQVKCIPGWLLNVCTLLTPLAPVDPDRRYRVPWRGDVGGRVLCQVLIPEWGNHVVWLDLTDDEYDALPLVADTPDPPWFG
jgi:hypothetical protein